MAPYESHLMLSSVRPAGVPLHFLMHRLHLRLQRGSLQAGLLARCDIVLFHVISSWSITPYHLLFWKSIPGVQQGHNAKLDKWLLIDICPITETGDLQCRLRCRSVCPWGAPRVHSLF